MEHTRVATARVACPACTGVVAALVLLGVAVGGASEEPAPSLEALREKVLANEAKASLIRMDFRYVSEGNVPSARIGSSHRAAGVRGTHMQCVYAQDGRRVHAVESLYKDDELLNGYLKVINGEVRKMGVLPDLMLGRIDRIEKFSWGTITPLRASFRPFANNYLLSQLLVSEHASIRETHATIDARDAVIVEINRPDRPRYYSRIWIDVERGMPLRMEHYYPNASATGGELGIVVAPIKLHELPNGGWIPMETAESLYRYDGTRVARSVVDVNSISIEKKDIPDSLFDIQFPPGAKIENAIIGREATPDRK